jgi:hypothetical protein
MAGVTLPSKPLAPPNDPMSCNTTKEGWKWVEGKWSWDPRRKLYAWVLGHFERGKDSQGKQEVSEDALKLLYQQNFDQFKYYLTWRQLMFAGYFAVFGALSLGLRWTFQNSPAYTFVCPFLGALVSLVFWALDHRNLQLYEIVGKASVAIEQALGDPRFGYFFTYECDEQEHPHRLLKHKWILTFFYVLGGLIMLSAGILTLIYHPSIPPQTKGEVGARLVAGFR